jgi:hypothetical protein
MNEIKGNSWRYLNRNANHESSASREIFGGIPTVLFIGAVLLLWAVILSGCGSVGEITDEVADTGDNLEDVMRSGEQMTEEAGETAEELKETGQKLRGLRSKKLTLELAKGRVLDGVSVRVRPAGSNQHKTVPAGDFARYTLNASRFVDRANFSIYTEINGKGRALKVSQEYFNDQQDGPAEMLVLTEVRENEFAWMPPSERDDDQTIRFNGN